MKGHPGSKKPISFLFINVKKFFGIPIITFYSVPSFKSIPTLILLSQIAISRVTKLIFLANTDEKYSVKFDHF